MKLPRDLSGDKRGLALSKHFGYRRLHQEGGQTRVSSDAICRDPVRIADPLWFQDTPTPSRLPTRRSPFPPFPLTSRVTRAASKTGGTARKPMSNSSCNERYDGK